MRLLGYYAFVYAAFGVLAGALLHIIVLFGGAEWVKFVGAPETIVQSSENGTLLAPVGAISIALLLTIMAIYAFSGAGLIRKLPYLKSVTLIISIVFILRSIILSRFLIRASHAILNDIPYQGLTTPFMLFHIAVSVFILSLGISFAIGFLSLKK